MLLLDGGKAQGQFGIVHDPANKIQSIINSVNEMANTSKTAENTLENFKESVKIYEQTKGYYDKLRAVSDLVREARKVQQSILIVGDISQMYVENFDRMLTDKHFTDKELSAIAAGYTRLLQGASDQLVDLRQIINPTDMSMNDKERLDLIDRIYNEIVRYRDLAEYYTRKNISVAFIRSRKAGDLQRVTALYGGTDSKYW